MDVVSVSVCVQVGAVEDDVFECTLSLVAEGAGVCVTEVDSVGVGWQYGVVSASESGQVDSVFSG